MKEFLTPIQAIKKKCLECCNGQRNEIKSCLIKTCPLYPYRIGEYHSKKNKDNEEQLSLELFEMED